MRAVTIKTKFGFNKNQTENLHKTTSKLKRKNLYWITQVSGWGILTIANLLVISSFGSITLNQVALWIFLGFVGLIVSHLYRYYIKKHNWSNLPLKKIAPRVILGSFISGLIIFIPVYLTEHILQTDKNSEHLIASIAMSIINLTSIMLVW